MKQSLGSKNRIIINHLPPVPTFGRALNAGNYRNIPVNTESSLFLEGLVELRDYGVSGVPYYFISDGSNPPYYQRVDGSIPQLLVRESVAVKLQMVNIQLEQLGLELFVWDAYRPLATQIGIWRFFEESVRRKNPLLRDEDIYEEVIKYVSDPREFSPSDSSTWPTHMTGASVDLTIRNTSGLEICDMGAEFDQMDEVAHTDHFENLLRSGEISGEDPRLLNRRLLHQSMAEQGFTNYPLEYWHFDWGNQMHQFIKSLHNECSVEPASYGICLTARSQSIS